MSAAVQLVPDLSDPLAEPRPRTERPIKVKVAEAKRPGAFWWYCRSCLVGAEIEGNVYSGHAPTIAAAVDAALEHRTNGSCPDAHAASRRLLEAVFLVPDYRGPVAVLDDGSALYACSRCPAYVTDRTEHTDAHLSGLL